jgi:hypothetical protein
MFLKNKKSLHKFLKIKKVCNEKDIKMKSYLVTNSELPIWLVDIPYGENSVNLLKDITH